MTLGTRKVMMASSKSRLSIVMGTGVVVLVILGYACSVNTQRSPLFAPAPSPVPIGTRTDSNPMPTGTGTRPNPVPIGTSTPSNPVPISTDTRPNPMPTGTGTRPNPVPIGTNTPSNPVPISTDTRPNDTGRSATIALPPQGLYESCLPSKSDCLARLTEMGVRGFRIVLNDGLRYANSARAVRAYADQAAKLGMKVILPIKYSPEWDDDDRYLVKAFDDLASEGGSTDNLSFLTYYIGILKDHPALWGYYMADEVHSEYHDGLQVYADMVKTLDPYHPRLIVEEGTNDPMEIFFTFHSYMSDTTDVLALDNYPYGYIDTYGNLSRYTGESADMLQYWSDKLRLKSAIVLQAFAWTQYQREYGPLCFLWPLCAPFPNREQMKAQRDQAILNSRPEMILWYYYPDLLNSDDPAQHWNDLVAAAFAPLAASTPSPTPRPQECPSGWTCEDIGNPKLEGTQSLNGNVWAVEGSGWDIWSTMWKKADQFRYIWQELIGDGQFSARITEQTNTNATAKAGVMLRKTFDPTSPYYAVFMTPRGGMRVQYRSGFNQNTTNVASPSEMLPVYLRISRTGTTYSAYTSADGDKWTLLPGSTVSISDLNGALMAGLAVTSRNTSLLGKAQFDNIAVVQPGRIGLPTLTRQPANRKEF